MRAGYFDFDEWLVAPLGGKGRFISRHPVPGVPIAARRRVDDSAGESRALVKSLRSIVHESEQRSMKEPPPVLRLQEQASSDLRQMHATRAAACNASGVLLRPSVPAAGMSALVTLLGRYRPDVHVVKFRQSPAVLAPVSFSAFAANVPSEPSLPESSTRGSMSDRVTTARELLLRYRALRWPGVRRDLRTKCFVRIPQLTVSPHRLLIPSVHGPPTLLEAGAPPVIPVDAVYSGDAESLGVELVPAPDAYFLHFMNLGQHVSLSAPKQQEWARAASVCDEMFSMHIKTVAEGAFGSI
jgi:hypothetical protein